MTGMVKEADDLLRLIHDLLVAYAAGICKRHRAALGELSNVLDTDEKVLNFSRLLTDCLRKNYGDAIRIGSLSASDDGHVGSVGTAAGEHVVAGKNERVGEHLDQLLVRQGQVSCTDDGDLSRTRLLNQKQFLSQFVECRNRRCADASRFGCCHACAFPRKRTEDSNLIYIRGS